MNIPETTLAQLGGASRLSVMIGARHFSSDGRELSFRFTAKASNGANWAAVTLDEDDTYSLRFARVSYPRGGGEKVVERGTFAGVYVEQLRRAFESATGLRLSL